MSRRRHESAAALATGSPPGSTRVETPQACSARIVRSRSPAPCRLCASARRASSTVCPSRLQAQGIAAGRREPHRHPGRVQLAAGLAARSRRSRRRRSGRPRGRTPRAADRESATAEAGAAARRQRAGPPSSSVAATRTARSPAAPITPSAPCGAALLRGAARGLDRLPADVHARAHPGEQARQLRARRQSRRRSSRPCL